MLATLPFTPRHAQRLKFITDAGFIRNRTFGFCLIVEDDYEQGEIHRLWLFERDGSSAHPIAEAVHDPVAAAPSPDGQSIAVLGELAGHRQLFLIDLENPNNSDQLTQLPQGVTTGAVWSPDGARLAFTAGPPEPREPTLPYWIDRATFRLDGLGLLDDVVQDIFTFTLEDRSLHRLTNDRLMKTDPRWSPDSSMILSLASFSPDQPYDFQPQLHLYDLETGERRVLIDEWGAAYRAEWFGSNKVAFLGHQGKEKSSLKQRIDLWTLDITSGELSCRTSSITPGVGCSVQSDLPICDELMAQRISIRGDTAYLRGQVGGDIAVYRVGLDGDEAVEQLNYNHGSSYLLDADAGDSVLHLRTSVLDPPDLALNGTRLTALNDELLAGVQRPVFHKMDVTAGDGLQFEAWALTPPTGQGPWPTILYIHGGPHFAFGSTYNIDFQLLVSAGFAVVFHNFRGSTGYGTDFAEALQRYWGDSSLDHHGALDEAIRLGIADPERLGVCGVSYGGFATCWLVGTSRRFSAAVAENPFTSWTSMYGGADSEWWIPRVFGGTPDELPEVYREQSPLAYASECETPLLFIVGEADLRCPPLESEQYFRVLKRDHKTTAMLRLPHSGHIGTWNGPIAARAAQNHALVEWFQRFLLPDRSIPATNGTGKSKTVESTQTPTRLS